MNKYQEALDYAKKHLDSKQDIEKVEVLQGLIDKATQKENTLEFNSFKLHADGTLKNMLKDELISYIHVLHHNWSVSDEQLFNVIKINNKLQDELDVIKNLQPYKFEELKKGMWVWDDKFKDCMKIKIIFKPCKSYPNGSLKAYHDLNEETLNFIEFEEGRFFPVTKALEYQK